MFVDLTPMAYTIFTAVGHCPCDALKAGLEYMYAVDAYGRLERMMIDLCD
jgi:hypothetical protein